MKCFQVLGSVVLVASTASAAAAVYGGALGATTYGASYGFAAPASTVTYGVSHAAPSTVSYGIAHAAPIATRTVSVAHAAPIATRTVSVAAAPAVAVAAAPALAVAAAPVVHHSTPAVRSHEIHTGGAPNQIRVEEYKAGGQLIRVHESAQPAPEVVNVQGPAAAANHIRVISRTGPTQVQRAVFQDPSTQVFDVVNPPKPADRIINIRGSPAPPAHVELVADQHHAAPEITVGGDEPNIQVVRAGVAAAPVVARSLHAVHAAPAAVATTSYHHAAPAIATYHHTAPAVATTSYHHAAPAIATYHHTAPAVATTSYHHAAPAIATYHHSAPAISYGSTYGFGYGSTGYGSSAVLHKA